MVMPHARHLRLGWFVLALASMCFLVTFCSGFRLSGWGWGATFSLLTWMGAGWMWGRVGLHAFDSAWLMLAVAALFTGVRHLPAVVGPLQHEWTGTWGAQWAWGAAWVLLGSASCQFVQAWRTRPALSWA
jgi:hypothetical protein